MYSIDLNTATPREVIQRSITCHPSLFIESMMDTQRVHDGYWRVTDSELAARAAYDAARACEEVTTKFDDDDVDAIVSDVRLMVPALHNACRLQCIGFMESDIVERHQD